MSQTQQGFMKALKCRECGREYALGATHVCEFDFGPLEVAYDYERIKKVLSREVIQSRSRWPGSRRLAVRWGIHR
jgi:threonine synthase